MIRLANYLLRNNRILSFVLFFCSKRTNERVLIEKFKAEFTIFGHNIDDLSDEEIKEGIGCFALLSKDCGLTIDEVGQSIKAVAQLSKTI